MQLLHPSFLLFLPAFRDLASLVAQCRQACHSRLALFLLFLLVHREPGSLLVHPVAVVLRLRLGLQHRKYTHRFQDPMSVGTYLLSTSLKFFCQPCCCNTTNTSLAAHRALPFPAAPSPSQSAPRPRVPQFAPRLQLAPSCQRGLILSQLRLRTMSKSSLPFFSE